jgi:hypothetical protein
MTELSPFNRMALYSSNRRQGLQPLTGFTTQQDDRTFTIQSHGAVFIQPPSGFTTADGVHYAASWPNFHHSPFTIHQI